MKRLKMKLLITALTLFSVMLSIGSVMADGHHSIVDVAAENGNFTTLLAAADAAGLAEMLDQNGPFTVFAPTDAAFAALPAGTVEALLADPMGDLRQILLYHIVQGEVPAADVVTLDAATTALGKNVGIEVVNGDVILNGGAKVIITDIEANNGIIHVIDAVLLPPTGWGAGDIGTAAGGGATDAGDDAGMDDDDMEDKDGDMEDHGDMGEDKENADTPMGDGDGAGPGPASGNGAEKLLKDMEQARHIIEQMGGVLDRSYRGEQNLCGEYLGYHRGLEMSPVTEGLSPELQGFQDIYVAAIAKVVDTNLGVKEVCEDSNKIAQGFTRDVARIGINAALDMLIPAIEVAQVVFETLPAAMPAMPTEEQTDEDAEMPEEPMEEMPDEPMEEPMEAEMPAGMDPIDTNGDGELSDPEIEAASEAYIERVEMYLNTGPLPFNGSDLYADMYLSLNFVLGTALFAGAEDCDFLAALLFTVVIAPEYKDVPAEWMGIYSNYRAVIVEFANLYQPYIESCESTGTYTLTDAQAEQLLIDSFILAGKLGDSIEGALNMLGLPAPYARELLEAIDMIVLELPNNIWGYVHTVGNVQQVTQKIRSGLRSANLIAPQFSGAINAIR